MGTMNFDVFQKVVFPEDPKLLEDCRTAEKFVRIDPYNTIASSRSVLEKLCKALLKRNHLRTEPDAHGSLGLSGMVETCVQYGLFSDGTEAHKVRKDGNAAVHNLNKALGIPLKESLHTNNQANIRKAENVAQNLYQVMTQVFRIQVPAFDPNKIPFNEYEILRAVPKAPREVILGDYNYFIRNVKGECYYLQIFPKNARDESLAVLSERLNDAAAIVREKRGKAALKNTVTLFDLRPDTDREMIASPAFDDSLLLSELQTPMTPAQALGVCIDLTNQLLEMLKLKKGLHHRNIQPGCILLDPDADRYLAGLVNFQTAKIENHDKTVQANLPGFHKDSFFMPPVLRYVNPDYKSLDWGKVDVYSVAKVLVYCVAPELLRSEVEPGALYDYFSDDMVECLRNVFGSSLQQIYTLDEWKGILENEASKY